MAFYLCPISTILQYFTDVGVVLAGGKINTYLAGTTTPTATWTDITGITPNSNPITLNAAGRLPNVQIWQAGGVPLKIVITDSNNNLIGPTFDQISGIDDVSLANSQLANPASGSGADLVANAMRSYDIFATARAANVPVLQAGQTLIVDFEGGVTVADGLGGLFYWNSTSTASDDNINIIQPTGLSNPGRYLRLNPYLEAFAVKNGATARASNTTPAIDPDLKVVLPQGGTYIFQGWLNDLTGNGAGGMKGTMAYSGAFSTGLWGMNGNGTGVTPVVLNLINAVATFQTSQAASANMWITGSLLCTAGGTLSFNWSQNASNATASAIGPGSSLRVTRVSSATGSFSPVTQTFSTAGSFTASVPVGASNLTLEIWGGAGGGNTGSGSGCAAQSGGGGGSGGYSESVFSVAAVNGQTITLSIGTAGSGSGGNGGTTTASSGTFSITTMNATGGGGGQVGGSGLGGTAGTGGGGNTTNSSGNAGQNGSVIGGGGTGGGVVGVNGTGTHGGTGGFGSAAHGTVGGAGLAILRFT